MKKVFVMIGVIFLSSFMLFVSPVASAETNKSCDTAIQNLQTQMNMINLAKLQEIVKTINTTYSALQSASSQKKKSDLLLPLTTSLTALATNTTENLQKFKTASSYASRAVDACDAS